VNRLQCFLFLIVPLCAFAQGTFIYDQQSSTDESPPSPQSGANMNLIPPPWGQSFTPSFAGVDFIRLKLNNEVPGARPGATIYLNIRADSIMGTILSRGRNKVSPLFRVRFS
jgi:hypothetical protein